VLIDNRCKCRNFSASRRKGNPLSPAGREVSGATAPNLDNALTGLDRAPLDRRSPANFAGCEPHWMAAMPAISCHFCHFAQKNILLMTSFNFNQPELTSISLN
jgi:hypothetical protein